MHIPHYKKENPNDCGCAPVCLRMALDYFDIKKDINDLYALCDSMGDVHYTLPWGLCKAVAEVGLYCTFISKEPSTLLDSSYNDIETITGISAEIVKNRIDQQIDSCKADTKIKLTKWQDGFKNLPKELISRSERFELKHTMTEMGINQNESYFINSLSTVLIPTLWWGQQPHNVVLVNYMDTGEEMGSFEGPDGYQTVYYHDPNLDDILPTMTETEFFKKWIHPYTDNDLLIIAKQSIDVESILKNTNAQQ